MRSSRAQVERGQVLQLGVVDPALGELEPGARGGDVAAPLDVGVSRQVAATARSNASRSRSAADAERALQPSTSPSASRASSSDSSPGDQLGARGGDVLLRAIDVERGAADRTAWRACASASRSSAARRPCRLSSATRAAASVDSIVWTTSIAICRRCSANDSCSARSSQLAGAEPVPDAQVDDRHAAGRADLEHVVRRRLHHAAAQSPCRRSGTGA